MPHSEKDLERTTVNLTIFAVPKAFEGLVGVIQTNAITSWTMIRPRPEIFLLGDDAGIAEIAHKLGIRHLPKIRKNEYGTPLLNDIFEKAEKEASNSLLCYVNSDIILPTFLLEVVSKVPFSKFLIVGQRWNLDVTTELDFQDTEWEKKLDERRRNNANLESVTGIDYFIYPRGSMKDIPAFAIGRTVWDNWLVFSARLSKIPVMDATPVLTVIHQNHGYGSPEAKKTIWTGPEAQKNLELAGGYSSVFDVSDANYTLLPQGWKRQRFTKTKFDRELYLNMKRHPKSAIYFRFIQKLLDPEGLWQSIRIRFKRIFLGC